MNSKIFVSILGIFVNLCLAIGKILVGWISKSTSVFADGINSGTDVIASTINFIGVKISEKPADEGHPYGHGKAEVLSGFIITIIIFISGLAILYEAVKEIIFPSKIEISIIVFIVMGISAATNGIMSFLKIRAGKKHDSISLISDGIHSRIDLLVSVVIFAGLFLMKYSSRIDSVLALFVGIYILKESLELGKNTTDILLGASAGKEIEDKIKKISNKLDIQLTDLKTQKRGSQISANLEIILPSKTKVEDATQISEKLRKTLVQEISEIDYVAIQIKSHKVKTSYFNHPMGRFRWNKESQQEEYCICKKCGYKTKHRRGIPCSTLTCPKCKSKLIREGVKNA